MSGYGVASIFLIRIVGVPFEVLEPLGTPNIADAARNLLRRRQEFTASRTKAAKLLAERDNGLSPEAFRALRTAVKSGRSPGEIESQIEEYVSYRRAAMACADAEEKLDFLLTTEITTARHALLAASREILPPYLIFGADGVHDLLAESLPTGPGELLARNKRAKERERHLLLYLQRVCTKNDSFSEFGPTAWGKTAPGEGVAFAPAPGIALREAFLERWTAHAAAAAINGDLDVFAELAPRCSPNGRLENGSFIFSQSGEAVPLPRETRDLIERCDGLTSVRALGVPPETVRALVEEGMLLCALEVPALEPDAFEKLRDVVQGWGPGQSRDKWLAILQPIAELPLTFARTEGVEDRQGILHEARARLHALGGDRKAGGRSLYAAVNPIGEECFRVSNFEISDKMLQEVAVEAAPWIDLWRDCYAFVASRVAVGLRGILKQMPAENGSVPLPAFLSACEEARMGLKGPGLVALAHIAFQEVKAAFRERMKEHVGKADYELTIEDCHFVRRNFEYAKFDEYTYPSADLQLAAESMRAVRDGAYQWVLAELHPPVALLHHGAYWSCPDAPVLSRALRSTVFGQPSFHFGFFAVDFTSHTTVRQFDALPELTHFIAPQRCDPKWKTVAPSETEVFVDESSGDVCVRERRTKEYLGSFARAWVIPLGFHPFYFGQAPGMPRLRCGKVVVQRRSWTVTFAELAAGDFTGVSRDLVLAVEQLRAARDLPRYIYIRPTEQALRRSGVEGRDKDTKPVFVDLESYLFIEIFHRWLVKAGELEVTEMLPDPDHLCWQEADGRRTFELRTLIVPRT